MNGLILSAFLLCSLSLLAGDAATPDARKREFESIQKELETLQPPDQPTREQIMTYIEVALDKYSKFAKANPKTPEGFEAAFNLAMLLTQTRHPKALEYSEFATTVAPAAGVDVKRVAMCWTMVAQGQVAKGDMSAAQTALNNIKPLDEKMYEQISAQFKEMQDQMAAQKAAQENLKPGKAPPEIKTKDLAGQEVTFGKFKGKVLLIDFWAGWCGPCMRMMPGLVQMYKQHKEAGLEILGINLDQTDEAAQAATKKAGATWTIARDQAIAEKWGIQSIPSLFLLDRKGIIRHVNIHSQELDEAIKALLKETP
ncbi:MAG TPA: redoxin family protein [Planctomycetota bacterium]|nr:redoxin family protein [Planctomycetota bacterium]